MKKLFFAESRSAWIVPVQGNAEASTKQDLVVRVKATKPFAKQKRKIVGLRKFYKSIISEIVDDSYAHDEAARQAKAVADSIASE